MSNTAKVTPSPPAVHSGGTRKSSRKRRAVVGLDISSHTEAESSRKKKKKEEEEEEVFEWVAGDSVELLHRTYWWPATVESVDAEGDGVVEIVGSRRDWAEHVNCSAGFEGDAFHESSSSSSSSSSNDDKAPKDGGSAATEDEDDIWYAALPYKDAHRRLRRRTGQAPASPDC